MRPLSPATLSLAYAADLAFGDPERMPHPVRLMGRLVAFGERQSRPGSCIQRDFATGAALSLLTIFVAYLAGCIARMSPLLESAGAWTTLATGSLLAEASAVIDALESEDLPRARSLVARIVGRDTAALSAPEVSRALVETLAESLCDGIVAPLFYLSLGGLPLAMAYKAVNTLDSMIGHNEHPTTYFGRAAARLDDGANFLPARISAVLIIVAAATQKTSGEALATWLADGEKHPSPNAGQSEAAMAGAVNVRLGGVNYYGGVPSEKPVLGQQYGCASVGSARTAIRLTRFASLLAFACALGYTLWSRQS